MVTEKAVVKTPTASFKEIAFKMHPRVFAALGADLVTNDVVAVIELVKNSYDAFAENVWVRFGNDSEMGSYLELSDDGFGMTEETIENVWCLVATPFKDTTPFVRSGEKKRRVVGEKGLGRLSAARLADQLHMLTQVEGGDCLEVKVNWSEICDEAEMSSCKALYRKYTGATPFTSSGTRLRLSPLKYEWDSKQTDDLEDNLARLISPFEETGDFKIYFRKPNQSDEEEVNITSPDFLNQPVYTIKGEVDSMGHLKAQYSFSPLNAMPARKQEVPITWSEVVNKNIEKSERYQFDDQEMRCGPFEFEIRAWDLGAEDTQEISDRFSIQKSKIRNAIRAHKGISVYRDGVLVLPKSENARDWLGLDLRRVSHVGKRLSTSQIVGYVSVSAEKNPRIKDTSDREQLAVTLEVMEFTEYLKAIVSLLENERHEDRSISEKEGLQNLFESLSAEQEVTEVTNLAAEGAKAEETLPIMRDL